MAEKYTEHEVDASEAPSIYRQVAGFVGKVTDAEAMVIVILDGNQGTVGTVLMKDSDKNVRADQLIDILEELILNLKAQKAEATFKTTTTIN